MDHMVFLVQEKIKSISRNFDLTTYEERFAAAFDIMSTYNIVPDAKCKFKDAKESINLKNMANNIYISSKNNVEELFRALALYTQSIAMAPDKSEELSISYANRSALLIHICKYKECLEDINRALHIKYPDHLKGKLLIRKVECLKYLKDVEVENIAEEARSWLKNTNISVTDKKVYEEKLISISSSNNGLISSALFRNEIPSLPMITHQHKQIPCASDAVSLKYSQQYGKHLVAKRRINVGEILIIEKPYAYVLFPEEIYTHCAYCFQIVWAAIPCEHCVYAVYCSEKCRNEALVQSHDIECSLFGYLLNSCTDQRTFLSLRIIFLAIKQAGNINEFKKCIEKIKEKDSIKKLPADDGIFDNEKYETVYALGSNVQKDSERYSINAMHAAIVTFFLYTKTNFFNNGTGCKLKAIQNMDTNKDMFCNGADYKILKELKKMGTNKDIFFIGSLILRHLHIIPENGYIHFETDGFKVKPTASYVAGLLSLINHSCVPNASLCSTRVGEVMYAVLPIEKGSQIFYHHGRNRYKKVSLSTIDRYMMNMMFCKCMECTRKTTVVNYSAKKTKGRSAVSKLIKKCNSYKNSLLSGVSGDKEKIITDLSQTIDALVKHMPPSSDDIFSAVEVLENFFDAKYGISHKITVLRPQPLK